MSSVARWKPKVAMRRCRRSAECSPAFQPRFSAQTGADQQDVLLKLLRRKVRIGTTLVGIAQALTDLREEYSIWHAIVARRRDATRARQQGAVLIDALLQRGGHADAARALRQPLCERLALLEVRIQHHLLLARERLADGLRVHIGVAVHSHRPPRCRSAAAPAARVTPPARRTASRAPARSPRKRPAPPDRALRSDRRVRAHAHRLPSGVPRMIFGLPAGGDFRADRRPDIAALPAGSLSDRGVEQQLRHVPLFPEDGAARGLGRVGGETPAQSTAGR